MIHFTCDGCERQIDTEREPRYILRLEVYTAPESADDAENGLTEAHADSAVDPERDYLAEIDDLLERVDGCEPAPINDDLLDDDDSCGDEYRQVRYDLCSECRQRMLSNPLALLAVRRIDFSEN